VEAQIAQKVTKEKKCFWGKKIAIHRSASGSTASHKGARDGKSIAKGDGDGEAWIGSYSKKKTCNTG
jgi:hypothetical protein